MNGRHRHISCDAAEHHQLRLIGHNAKGLGDLRIDSRSVRTRVQHQPERSPAIDQDGRPDATNFIAARRCDELGLRRLHHHFREVIRRLSADTGGGCSQQRQEQLRARCR